MDKSKEMTIRLPGLGTQKEIVKQEESGLFEGIRLETRFKFNEGWTQPNHDEVRLIINKLGLTGSQVAKLVGVNSRTVRKWMADPETVTEKKSAQKIPYAAWRLLVLELESNETVTNQ